MAIGASGLGAGPLTTEPSLMLYLLPWHGQSIVPLATTTATAAPAPAIRARRLAARVNSGSVMNDSSALDSEGREEPVSGREPDEDQRREHNGAEHGQHPSWHPALGQHQHLDRERTKEEATQN